MNAKFVSSLAIITFAAVAPFNGATAATLTSADGRINLDGQIKSYDGTTYVIQSGIGEVVLDAAGITCSGHDCPGASSKPITLAGVGNLADTLIPALLEGYSFSLDADMLVTADAARGTEIVISKQDGTQFAEVSVIGADSTSSFEALATGSTDLALVTREITDSEAQLIAATGQGDLKATTKAQIAAFDGIVVVTHRSNPIGSLSQAEIADVFSGKITNWLELGGADNPINLYIRGPGTGTGQAFTGLIMSEKGRNFPPKAKIMGSDTSLSDAVAADPSGIGFTSFSAERNARAIPIRGECGILTPANQFTIKTEEYPYVRRIYSYLPQRLLPWTLPAFQSYLLSDDAQEVIAQAGYVDQAVSDISMNEQGLRFATAVLSSETTEEGATALKSLMTELITANRLSMTFRFNPGSAEPDTRAESDLARLAGLMADGSFPNKELLFVGFSDSHGDNAANLELSQKRSDVARDMFLNILPEDKRPEIKVTALGYGELAPLACDDTDIGRQVNRRVEVWVRDITYKAEYMFRAD